MSLTHPCPSGDEALLSYRLQPGIGRTQSRLGAGWLPGLKVKGRQGWEWWGQLGQGKEEGRAQEEGRPHQGSPTSPGCLSPFKPPCPASRSPGPCPWLCKSWLIQRSNFNQLDEV